MNIGVKYNIHTQIMCTKILESYFYRINDDSDYKIAIFNIICKFLSGRVKPLICMQSICSMP